MALLVQLKKELLPCCLIPFSQCLLPRPPSRAGSRRLHHTWQQHGGRGSSKGSWGPCGCVPEHLRPAGGERSSQVRCFAYAYGQKLVSLSQSLATFLIHLVHPVQQCARTFANLQILRKGERPWLGILSVLMDSSTSHLKPHVPLQGSKAIAQ